MTNNTVESINAAINKAKTYKAYAEDFIQMMEILIVATTGFKTILEKRGSNNE